MKNIKAIVLIMLISAPLALWAQGPGGGDDDLDDPGIPLDGGASLLAGAAIMYGVKKMRDGKQDKREQH